MTGYLGTDITKDCYNFDRTIGLTVTYNFNTTRSKYKGSGAGNDEKNRLKPLLDVIIVKYRMFAATLLLHLRPNNRSKYWHK